MVLEWLLRYIGSASVGGNNNGDGCDGSLLSGSSSFICKMYSTFSECTNAMRENLLQIV